MQTTYSVFTYSNTGIAYSVKNLFESEISAEQWRKAHDLDQRRDPIYTPEGVLTFMRYPNGLFVKPIHGIIELRIVVSDKGKHRRELLYPGETREQAIERINHTPHSRDMGQVVKMY